MSTIVKNDKKTIFSWAMYDWANSAYATTSGAIVAPFFTGAIVPDEGYWGISAGAIWSYLVAGGAFLLVLIMPILGAMADFSSSKRRFLQFFAYLGAAFTAGIFFVPAGGVVLFMLIFLVSQIGFVAANVFYDGFLPLITTDETIDKVSSKGFALGYIGGGLYVLLGFVLIVLADTEAIGLSLDSATRIAIAGAGVWWVLFTLYALRAFPADGVGETIPAAYANDRPFMAYAKIGLARTIGTTKKLKFFPQILLFIVAFMFYNNGTQTVINISGAYAEDILNLELQEVIIAFLIVQFVAFGGAFAFGWISGKVGPQKAILGNLVIWTGIGVGAYFLPEGEAFPFYVLAFVVGFVLGGVQALSRSLYGTMIPEEASAEFYGFFSVFSKSSAILGPLVFGVVTSVTDDGRIGIVSVVIFFIIGGFLLARVDVDEARASKDRWSFEGTDVST